MSYWIPSEAAVGNNRPFDDLYIAALYMIYLRAPRQQRPDLDGHYSLGEIGQVKDKDWTRLTPYSPAEKEMHHGQLQMRPAQLPWS